ncbi:MAG: CHAD domain-containing protein [Acidimicrobiales bacterium]
MTNASFTRPDLDPAAVIGALAEAGFALGPPRPFRRTVLDTFDGRLHDAGLRLELSEADDDRELVLVAAGSPPAQVVVTGPPRFADDLPAGPMRSRLRPVLDVRALLPAMVVTGTRRSAAARGPSATPRVDVAVHEGLAVEGRGPTEPGWVAEVGELTGYAKEAERARRLLSSFGLRRHDTDLLGLMATAAAVDLRGFAGSPTVPLDRGEPSLGAFRRVLSNLADAVDANWPGTVEDLDPEFLHDLRVAVRRTRSVLDLS